MVVATSAFAPLARQVAASHGLPSARIAVVEHPLGGIDAEAVRRRAEAVVEAVLALSTGET